ncbi:MAG: PAS domain-containing protein [Desulfobacterales bacterium]|nr:MAG: PAS domain-containing protein [Desulfobacterales bacterium]
MGHDPLPAELVQRVAYLEADLAKYKDHKAKAQWIFTEFKRLAERSKDGIYQFDVKARKFLFFNKTGIEMFASKKADMTEITPKSILLRIHPEDREAVRRAARDSLAPGCNGGEIEYRYINSDASFRWMYDRWVVMRDTCGQPQYIEGIVIDNTKRKLAEQALQDSEKKLRSLSSHLLKAQERERRRISLELHDELGQALTVLKLQVRSIKKNLREDQWALQDDCDGALKYMDQIIENVRRLSHDLSPSILEDLGLDAALRLLIDDFAKHSNIRIGLDMTNIDNLFSREPQVVIYRIFQEALTNIEKHAQATQVSIAIQKDHDHVVFRLADDGRGFDMKPREMRCYTERALGLTAMNERARMLGGFLELSSSKGQGTQIVFGIPTDKEKARHEFLSHRPR